MGRSRPSHPHSSRPKQRGETGGACKDEAGKYQDAYIRETRRNLTTINAVIYLNSDQVSRKKLIKMATTTTNKTSNFKTTGTVLGPLFSFCGKTRVFVA